MLFGFGFDPVHRNHKFFFLIIVDRPIHTFSAIVRDLAVNLFTGDADRTGKQQVPE